MSTTFAELGDAFSKVTAVSGTMLPALNATQSETIAAMKQQGIPVKAG